MKLATLIIQQKNKLQLRMKHQKKEYISWEDINYHNQEDTRILRTISKTNA